MFYSHPAESKEPGYSQNGVMFFFGPSLAGHKAMLPAGKQEDDFFINVVVVIKDAYGEFADKVLRIQVLLLFFK